MGPGGKKKAPPRAGTAMPLGGRRTRRDGRGRRASSGAHSALFGCKSARLSMSLHITFSYSASPSEPEEESAALSVNPFLTPYNSRMLRPARKHTFPFSFLSLLRVLVMM